MEPRSDTAAGPGRSFRQLAARTSGVALLCALAAWYVTREQPRRTATAAAHASTPASEAQVEPVADSLDLDLQPLPAALQSSRFPYRLVSPGPSWSMRSERSFRKGSVALEFWLVDPELGAQLTILPAFHFANRGLDLDRFAFEFRKAAKEEIGIQPGVIELLQARNTVGRRFDATHVFRGVELQYRFGVFVSGQLHVTLKCVGQRSLAASFLPACDRAFAGFEFLDAPTPRPDDLPQVLSTTPVD